VRRAGEDMARGDRVLLPGRRITPADLGVLASLGMGEVRVRRRLRVAFFSTGDELRSVGETLVEGQIYDSNRYTLHGMLTRLGVELLDLGVIRDDREAIRQAFTEAAAIADVVITSGGVSVGEADFVKQTLDELGQVDFWRIAMKPGKPLAFGRLGKAVFFGLPGNPVSVMATFYQFVQPALRGMTGESQTPAPTLWLTTETPLKKAAGRTDFQRGRLVRGTDGQWRVNSTGLQGSHVLTSMSQADCFVILPADCAGVAAGELVEVQPFAGLV
jgi:molybdopterin molybdotransferase